MKKYFSRMVSIVLALIMVVGMAVPAFAASSEYTGKVGGIDDGVTVTKDNAPLRASANGKDTILCHVAKGAVLERVGTARSGAFGHNKWYRVKYEGKEYFLFSENAEVHEHKYKKFYVEETSFKICDCGKVVFTTKQKVEVKHMESLAAVVSAAAGTATLDGPLPLGDIIGAGIVAAGGIFILTGELVDRSTMEEILIDVDYVEYIKNEKKECNDLTFRMVERPPEGGNLRKISDSCITMGQAYVYVRYCGGDVWCTNSVIAENLAQLNDGGYYFDGDVDALTHYNHIHLTTDSGVKIPTHIFYGTNDFGMIPT